MKVGLISQVIDEQRTGIGTYTYNLIEKLINMGKTNNLYLIHFKGSKDKIYTKTHEVITKVPFKFPKILIKLMQAFELLYIIDRINVDILHFPSPPLIQTIPLFLLKSKKILTIHDLTPLLYPETHLKRTVFLGNLGLRLIKNKIDFIIAVSQSTKNDCVKYLNIPKEKIKVIYEASDEIYQPIDNKQEIREEIYKKYSIDSPFILYVGTLEKRKNIPVLMRAFYKLKKMKIAHKLVIVGMIGWKYNDIFKTSEALNLQKDVIFPRYLLKEDLVKFYNLADLFVYPSLYEGFGLPPLEAMACGCPVITSNTSSLPEVVGDAGVMVNPYDVDELTNKMYEVLTDEGLKKELSKKGLERAKLFSWRKTAEETWKVYEMVYYGE